MTRAGGSRVFCPDKPSLPRLARVNELEQKLVDYGGITETFEFTDAKDECSLNDSGECVAWETPSGCDRG